MMWHVSWSIGGLILLAASLGPYVLYYSASDTASLSPLQQKWRAMGRHLSHTIKDGNDRNITLSIFYVDSQPSQSEGTPLLLLHGFPTSSFDFCGGFWAALSQDFGRLITFDYPGFGFSDKPRLHPDFAGRDPEKLYLVMNYVDIAEHVLEVLGVDKVHILAHDLGVTLTQELLARFRERGGKGLNIVSACLLNGGVFPELHRARPIQKLLLGSWGPVAACLSNFKAFSSGLASCFGREAQPSQEWLREAYAGFQFNEGRLVSHRTIHYMKDRREHRERWVGALNNTEVPTAMINGPDDPVSGRHLADHMREVMPHVQLTVLPDGIGHYPQVEAPALVLEAYKRFRNSLPSS